MIGGCNRDKPLSECGGRAALILLISLSVERLCASASPAVVGAVIFLQVNCLRLS